MNDLAVGVQTTHVGSLPRNELLTKLIFAKDAGEPVDEQEFDKVVRDAVFATVKRQKDLGIDIPSDGEMSKISYATYIGERLSGFDGDSPRQPPADLSDYPSFLKKLASAGGTPTYKRPKCVGPIKVKDMAPLEKDITNMLDAMREYGYTKGFMNSASPGVISMFQPSDYHNSAQDYLQELAEAMKVEYKTIVDSGLQLQIDAPDLALGRHIMYKEHSDDEFIAQANLHIEALNYALEGLPAESLRLHLCWGNYEGPHHCDLPLEKIMPVILQKARPSMLLFESANPRHAHEIDEWGQGQGKGKMPVRDDHILIPGVIDSTTNFIEHPKLVAKRTAEWVNLVGKERVILGTDCGFATFAGFGAVDGEIAYAKLGALVAGRDLYQKTQPN